MVWLRPISLAAGLVVLAGALVPADALAKRRERMLVEDVLSTFSGQFVVILRTQTKPARYLPIWVGEMEAVAIRMRLDRQEPPRPLTLNLLESVLSTSNIKVTEIAIDDHKAGVFLGRIRLKQNGRSWEVDARPSDAIGLAIGRGAPIWVTREVLEGAAIDPQSLIKPDLPEEPGSGAQASDYEETL